MTRLNLPLADVSRLLIVRLSAFGDIIHTLPSYSRLRRQYPDAVIDWLVEDRFAATLRTFQSLGAVLEVPRRAGSWMQRVGEYRRLRATLAATQYEAAIDFQGLTKSAIWPWLARIPVRVGYGDEDGRELSKVFYTHRVIPNASRIHVVERNLALAGELTGEKVECSPSEVHFPPDPNGEAWAEQYWTGNGLEGFQVAVLNPCSSWETKRWDPKGFVTVANWLTEEKGWKCLLVWGPGEESAARAVARDAPMATVLPPMTVLQLAEVLRRSSLCVSGDTGPLHLAAAVGVTCVGIYGPTDPRRNGPWGGRCRTVTFPVPCAPCWKTPCPYGHRECMTKLDPETVIQQIESLLGEL